MQAQRWAQIEQLFATLTTLSPDECAGFMDSACGADTELRRELASLLRAHSDKHGPLDAPPTWSGIAADDGAPSASEPAAAQPGASRVGPYVLLAPIAEGGMGAVWLAERADGLMKRKVALKLPHWSWVRPDLAARMAREREILAGLEHPNIARLYDAGVDALGRPYLAMEYVEGRPIDVYCRSSNLPIKASLELVLQVARAVAHAHGRLVVHRDLKPSNILVTADGSVRLLDFGIAKLLETDAARETRLTQLAGRAHTPEYASPEQVKGEAISTATDVYSLAVVAYGLLTGAKPYQLKRHTTAELEEAIIADDPLSASAATEDRARSRQLRGDLDAILNRALKKDPAERYATIDAFAQDIQRHLDGKPVQARPDSTTYRLGRLIARNKPAAAATTAVLIAIIAGAGAALWQAREARAQAARAEEVKGFILSIFEDADPDGGGSRTTTAIQLLQQARRRIDSELLPGGDPEVAVELMTSLGFSLLGLGEPEQAREIVARAVSLGESRLPADHRFTLAAKTVLGESLLDLGRIAEAADVLPAAAEGMRRIGDDRGLVRALRWTALLRIHEGRIDEAIATATEAVRLSEAKLGEADKRLRMETYGTLFAAMRAAQKPGVLEPATKSYALAREIYGDRPTVTALGVRQQYLNAMVEEGDLQAAVVGLKDLLEKMTAVVGRTNSEVVVTMVTLGRAQGASGDVDAAVATLREPPGIVEVLQGKGPGRALGVTHHNLGTALLAARQYAEAEATLRKAAEIFTAALGADQNDARLARSAHALSLAKLGRLDEAQAEFASLASSASSSPREAAVFKTRLGTFRNLQGRHSDAESMLREALAIYRKEPNGTSNRLALANTEAALGETLLALKRPREALDVLERSNATLQALQPHVSPDLTELRALLGRARKAATGTT